MDNEMPKFQGPVRNCLIENSDEYYSARKVAVLYGYPEPDNFNGVIEDALFKSRNFSENEYWNFVSQPTVTDFKSVIRKAIMHCVGPNDLTNRDFIYYSSPDQSKDETSFNRDDIHISHSGLFWVIRCIDPQPTKDENIVCNYT